MTGDSKSEKVSIIVVGAALGVILTVLILIIAYLLTHTPATAPIEIIPPAPTVTPEPSPTPGPLVVYVTGAVKEPGVVTIEPDARIENAVKAAGGLADNANLQAINLADPVTDGQHIHVYAEGEEIQVMQSARSSPASTGPVNINTATQDVLTTLPGIGNVTAENIIKYREENGPFERIEDIQNVPGIAEGKFDGCKELITVGP
ncbi:MAG: helix-hairpin-helix domain-containing protein [Anaerolineales bacterium]|nr:helix-hairpin-helix domain-containing protein [Anaerolineales bacterium]